MTRVRFPLPAPDNFFVAHIAQSVERYLGKVEVTGSTPVMSSSIVLRGLRSCWRNVTNRAILEEMFGWQKKSLKEVSRTLT
jgi:hypothetical protein